MKLLHGDCLELMPTLPDGSVDMVLADIPYGTTQCKWDSIIPLEPMWEQLKRIIKPNGAIVLMAQTPFDKVLGASNLPMLKYEWIWEKTTATGHLNAKKMPMKAHENALVFSDDEQDHHNMLVFYNKAPTYNPQKTTGHKRKVSRVKDKSKLHSDVYGKQYGPQVYDSTERYPRSVVTTSTDKQKSKLHPTQKPVALMEYFIKTYTNEGETVCDFAMGSGTTGEACDITGRKFIGIEKDADIFKTAEDRILNAMLGL